MTVLMATVMALSGVASIESLLYGMTGVSAEFLLLLVVACVAAPHSLNLGQNARISTIQPFMLVAIVLFGVRETVFLAAICLFYFSIVSRPRATLFKSIFNMGNYIVSGWISAHVFLAAGGRLGDVSSAESLVALLATTVTFFMINTWLVAVAIALEQKLNPFRVWFEKYSWTLSTYLAGASLVILVGMVRDSYGPRALFLIAPFCVMIYHYYRVYYDRASTGVHRT